ncbi:MAG TPA: hypothetical protein VMD49_09585 [Steroidobacteraceae bacterium]|nr:hypothetical protein [Steroidobacteraceae bacterium]
MARPYLLFVRAGADSLHRRLIAEDRSRNWDCCVSWYAPPRDEHVAEYYCDGGDNKLEGFLEFWKRRPRPWPYRYVWIMDDDVYLRPGDVSRFFEFCERYSTYVSQPALRWFTHTTLNCLVHNPACVLRRVSFVEVMAPCFSTPALERLIHTFDWTKSTWGTDWAWGCLLQGEQPLYVIDAIVMEHTRTGDGRPGAFYRKLSAMGIDPAEELSRVRRMFPEFVGARTLKDGHVFRPGLPANLAPLLWRLFEKLKVIVRIRKQLLRQWRQRRARLEDLVHGVR